MSEPPGELPLMTSITMPISSKSPLLPLSSSPNIITGSKNAMPRPSCILRKLQSCKELEGYRMDLYSTPMQIPSSMLPKEHASTKLYWDDLGVIPLFEVQSQYRNGQLPSQENMRAWESATCEVSSQTSDSSASDGGGGTRKAYQSPLNCRSRRERSAGDKQNMASHPRAIFKQESSFKNRISVFSPSVVTLDDNHQEEEDDNVMHTYLFPTRKANDFSGRRTLRTMSNRAVKASPRHASNLPKEALIVSSELSSTTESMSEKSSLASSQQSRLYSNWMQEKSVQRQSRYHREANSVAQRALCEKHSHLSGYQNKGEINGTVAAVQPRNFFQSECNGQRNHRHCNEPPLTADATCFQLAVPKSEELAVRKAKPRSLSQKYRPRGFEEIVGQQIVSQSLSNAIAKDRIAPVYLFQGPQGTGKTSVARIFAAALLCIAPLEKRPCGVCKECLLAWLGKSGHVKEVDAASHNGVAKVKALLEEISLASSSPLYKVFIIDECHVLTTETWNALLKILEEPPLNVVLILITTDSDQMPRTAASRCQKFSFPKIKDSDILKTLIKLADHESVELDLEVLHVIASRADGSLRDAEMILDQLGLLGKDINASTVQKLVGSASEGQMLRLLDSALRGDTFNTVSKARELVDAGVQPLSLMCQMATLIIDVLAGSYRFTEEQREGFFRRRTLSKNKLERLRKAVMILSEGEKQLRQSTNDRMTWLTATLLQLGPDQSCMLCAPGADTSVAVSPMTIIDSKLGRIGTEFLSPTRSFQAGDFEIYGSSRNSDTPILKALLADEQDDLVSVAELNVHIVEKDPAKDRKLKTLGAVSCNLSLGKPRKEHELSASKLADIWSTVVQNCRPFRLRQSLHGHGKLVSISIHDVSARVHLEFVHPEHKTRCERFWRNISDLFETALGCPVAVEFSFNPQHDFEQGFLTFPAQSDPKMTLSIEDCCDRPQSYDGLEHLFTIPQPSGASTLKELQENCETNSTKCLSTRKNLVEAKVLESEEQLDKAWICDDVDIFLPSSTAVQMCCKEAVLQNPKAALPVIPTARTHRLHAHDWTWTCEEVKEVVELNRMSLNSCTHELCDEAHEVSRNIIHGPEGRPSACGCNQKDNILRMEVHQLALCSLNRSLPGDYHNIMTCEKEISPRLDLPRDSGSRHNVSRFSGDIGAISGKQGVQALAALQLENKLKGAAGTIASFFQGKKSRIQKMQWAEY
ncbi:hypothetical protein GOP47_0026203 [Adiantum capillus-veneris]|nr:hypothetical protein GOP47_0026203 [Adiantum capillus-veneris]